MKSLTLVFLSLLFCKLSTGANQAQIESSYSEFCIYDESFDYIIDKTSDQLDCIGTLNFTINIPANCQRLLLVRTKEHIIDSDRLFFSIKTPLPIQDDSSQLKVSLPDMSWGTYFRIFAYFDNDTYIYSPTYCTNSYIDESDLKMILEQASVDCTVYDAINFFFESGHLSIETTDTVEIIISDLNGNLVFSDIISQPTSVNIDKATTPILICRYRIGNSIFTEKFIVK